MEFITLLPLPLVLLFLPTTVFIFVYKILFCKSTSNSRLPPGPKPLPLIGNLLELGDQPHQSFARLSKTHGPLMTLKLGSRTTIVASSSQTATLILQKYDHVFSNRLLPDIARVIDHHRYSVAWLPVSPEWRLLRKLLAVQVFGPKRLDAGQALRHQKVSQLVDFLCQKCRNGGGESVDIGQVAFITSLNLLSNTFFSLDLVGYQSSSSHEFQHHIEKIFELAGAPNVADFFPALKIIDPQGYRKQIEVPLRKICEILRQIVDERLQLRGLSEERSFSNDVLDDLLSLRKDDANLMDDNEIVHLLLDVFSAGTDTSSSTVEWAMTELMRNPDKMAKAQSELEEAVGKQKSVQESDLQRLPYLQAVVKETLRLHPPAPLLLPHKAEIDVEIDGFTVPKGAQIFVNTWAIGRDPKTWTNPQLFEPERFLGREIDYRGRDFELIPFGAGRRICPGLPLAHRMVQLMIATLLHSFNWKLENGMKPEDVSTKERFGLSLQKAEPLKAIPMMKLAA